MIVCESQGNFFFLNIFHFFINSELFLYTQPRGGGINILFLQHIFISENMSPHIYLHAKKKLHIDLCCVYNINLHLRL